MQIRILGSAAGGGFPQWNCGCSNCRAAREDGIRARPRLQSSIAVRGPTGGWLLVNASPDIRPQIETLREPDVSALRSSPIVGVLLTDAEIDHTAGLILLRESAEPLHIYGTSGVRQALTDGFPLLEVLARYCGAEWHLLDEEGRLQPIEEVPAGVRIEPFVVHADPPLYMRGRADIEGGLAIGLTLHDLESGTVATYAPAIDGIDDELMGRLVRSDVVLLDGTFWRDDELTGQGVGTRGALDMGHLPLSGPQGTIARLRGLPASRRILVHINNSNPVLLEDSAERAILEEAGFEVGYDGMVIDL